MEDDNEVEMLPEMACSAHEMMDDMLDEMMDDSQNVLQIPGPGSTNPQSPTTIRPIIVDQSVFWTPGETLRIGFSGGTDFQKSEVQTQAVKWCEWANLNFTFVTQAPYDIYISFDPGPEKGSWSKLGTRSRRTAASTQPKPSMNLGWINSSTPERTRHATILHEFGHALGLTHEHQNSLRYWDWDIDAIYKHYAGPPNKWNPAKVNRNVLAPVEGEPLRKNFLDQESIMLYSFPPHLFLKDGPKRKNYELSDLDKACMMWKYPGRKKLSEATFFSNKGKGDFSNEIYNPNNPNLFYKLFYLERSDSYTCDIDWSLYEDSENEEDGRIGRAMKANESRRTISKGSNSQGC